MYIILPINNFPERISYLSGKGNGFLFFRFWNPGGTYIRLFRETMPISRIGKRKMLYRLLIKNFILLSVLIFLSLSLNLLCVHLMFRGGKYNPSEISALNVFTMFWTNHPLLNNFVHILITSIIYGIMGMFCCATSFYFRNRKTVYFVSIFFWLIEILKPGSLLLIFQPFQINSTLTETASGLLLFFVPAILYICILTRRSIYE